MPRDEARVDLGDEARQYRTITRALLAITILLGFAAFAALRGNLPRETAVPALYLGAAASLAAAWSGYRGHRIALEKREQASRSGMIIVIASQLARQDDETLAGIVKRGGPAAEAAAMVLAGRKGKPRAEAAADA
jgi:hypothetical protein